MAIAFVLGCGGNNAVNPLLDPPAIPGDPSAALSNTYIGSQSPGLWSLTLDDTQTAFSYLPISNPLNQNNPVQGNFALQSGIANFGTTPSGHSAGMALDLTGRSAILRPGDNTTSPVAMVNPSGCFAVSGRVRFIFAGLQATQSSGNTSFDAAYGTFVISTSTDGKSWQIGDQRQYELTSFSGTAAGTAAPTGAPLEYNATCASTGGSTVVTAAANDVFTTPPKFVFNSAGYFVQDRPASTANPDSAGAVGLLMPSAPLSASDITVGSYRGLVFEPGAPGVPATQPMRLDPGSAKQLVGGVFPNDDPTAIANIQYTITLGAEDAALYGVFPKAKLVMSDPAGYCYKLSQNQNYTPASPSPAQSGFDVNGNQICTTEGVAVVGKPEGKYVIYFTALDGTTKDTDNAYTLQMYLYQQ